MNGATEIAGFCRFGFLCVGPAAAAAAVVCLSASGEEAAGGAFVGQTAANSGGQDAGLAEEPRPTRAFKYSGAFVGDVHTLLTRVRASYDFFLSVFQPFFDLFFRCARVSGFCGSAHSVPKRAVEFSGTRRTGKTRRASSASSTSPTRWPSSLSRWRHGHARPLVCSLLLARFSRLVFARIELFPIPRSGCAHCFRSFWASFCSRCCC